MTFQQVKERSKDEILRFAHLRTLYAREPSNTEDDIRRLIKTIEEITTEGERPIFKWTRTDCDDYEYAIEYCDLSFLPMDECKELLTAALRFIKPVAWTISFEWICVIPESKIHFKCKSKIIPLTKDLMRQEIDFLAQEQVEHARNEYLSETPS
jgi:hypothetical protein